MRKLALFVLVALLSFGFAGCKTTETAVAHAIDPSNLPKSICVIVKSVEYPAPDSLRSQTKVVFAWSWIGVPCDPIYLDGDQRANLKVGQAFKNCPTGWGYTDQGFSYVYQWTAPDRSVYLLFFPKQEVNSRRM